MREGVSGRAALCAVMLAIGAEACSRASAPDEDAMSAYLERHGIEPGTAQADAQADDDDASAPTAQPIARRVAITVERAHGLPDLDVGPGETDPYVILEYEGQRHRSSVREGELEPVWGDTFIFDVRPGGVLVVKLMDEDSLSSDEQIGTVSEVLPDLRVGETRTLSPAFRNGEGGTLELTLTGMVRP